MLQITFSQTMNVFTKTGTLSIKLSDIDSINFSSATILQTPLLTTTAVTNITRTTAVSGGTISGDGGAVVTARGVCWNTSGSPSIANKKTSDGIGPGSYTSIMTGLASNTTYYVSAYATNSVGTSYGSAISFITQSGDGKVTDIDGNVYNYITIGSQVWMIENLKTTKYRNGDTLSNITSDGSSNNSATGGYCDYDNNSVNASTYGKLYNWYAIADNRGLAPEGWHIPSDTEWTTLINYLGGENGAGGKLKETGTSHWLSPNTGATNEIGFTALPGGYLDVNGIFTDIGSFGNWWSSSEAMSGYAWYRHFYYNYGGVSRVYFSKKVGLSVRCIKN